MLRYRYGKVEYHGVHPHPPDMQLPIGHEAVSSTPEYGTQASYGEWKDPKSGNIFSTQLHGSTITGFSTEAGKSAYQSFYNLPPAHMEQFDVLGGSGHTFADGEYVYGKDQLGMLPGIDSPSSDLATATLSGGAINSGVSDEEKAVAGSLVEPPAETVTEKASGISGLPEANVIQTIRKDQYGELDLSQDPKRPMLNFSGRYGTQSDGSIKALSVYEVMMMEAGTPLMGNKTVRVLPEGYDPYVIEGQGQSAETSIQAAQGTQGTAVVEHGVVKTIAGETTKEGTIAPSVQDKPQWSPYDTVASPDLEPAEGAVVTADDAAVAANEVRGKSIDEITSEDIASMRMQGTFTDPSSGEPTRFSMTSPAGLDIMMGWNNDALMADPGSHNYLHNLVAAQEKSEISVPVGYEVYADQSGTLRLKMQAGVMPHAFGNFAATIQDPTYLAKVEQALNQNRMVTERINQKMKADFDIELRAQNPEIQEELTRKAEKHDAEMEMYSDNSEVQIANLSGLFRDERTGIMTDTMDKKKLVAELTGKWGELDTMDREKMIADLTGKYGEDTTIDYQKWQSDVTGYAMSPDGSRQIRTIMGQQTDIMEQRAKSEMLEIAGKALINTGKFDPETGEEIMEEMNSLKRDIHEHDKLIDQAKMMGWQAMEVQAKDADGKLLTNEDGTPMMVDKQVATLEREKMDIQGQQFTQVQALERAKMLSDTTGYVYKPVKKNGKWTVEQTGAATLGRAEINMRKTVANIAATAQTTVATTQKESAKKVAEINATSAKAVQTLKNNAIKLGIDNEITLLEKRIEQEFANAGIAATAASTARIAEYEMRKELVQAEIDAALDKETIEFDRQQAARALEFTNNLAKEEAFQELKLTAQDQFVIDKLEADQAYQLELKKISDAAAIAGETERGEQARLTQTDVAADELAAIQERAKEERATATSAQTIQKDIMAEEQRLAQQALEQRETYMSGVREQERGFLAIKPGEGVEGAKQLSNSFVTQLNSAIAGAVESGSYEDVGTVLGAALPPAPAGIVWDRASGAFQQRAGFEGREMDFATQQWMAAVTPAFKARDRAEQAIGVAQQLQVESMNRINERRQSEDDFRQAMLTADIDSAEEAIARQKMAETAAIATEQKMQHVQMLFNLLQNPVQLGMAKRHGLLGQIESVLGFTMNNVPTAEAGGAGVPTANAWQTMDSENQAFSIAAYVEQGGSPDDFMRMIASSVPAQMQQLQYGVL